jgi:hypothetical protein
LGCTIRVKNRLLVFEKKVLRTTCGPKIVDGVYNRRFNVVINVVKSNRMHYAGHLIKGAEDLLQRTLLRAMPEGRRNQGRPKSR